MAGEVAAVGYGAPDDYAIVVGINRYRTGIEPQLQGAVNDAELFYQWLIDPNGGGLDPLHVKKLTSPNQGPFDPSREDIENEIYEFYERGFSSGQKVGRRLYLFMAGHGVAPGDGEDCSLIAANSFVTPYRVLTGRLTADRVRRQPFFEEVVLFMACCRDVGGSATFTGLPEAGQPLPNSNFLHGLAVKWAKRAIEKQLPDPFDPTKPPLWQSVFAHALLKGLQSAVDDNGQITSLSLRNFVRQQVQALLPPDDNRPPQFFLDEDLSPIVFKDAVAMPPPGPGGPRSPVLDTADDANIGGRATARRGIRGERKTRGRSLEAAASEPPPPATDLTLGTSGLTPVEVVFADPASSLEVLDGQNLAKLDPPTERTAAGCKVYLKPSLYAFRVAGGPATPVCVLGEAFRVNL